MHAQIPPGRIEEAKAAAGALGDAVYSKFPFAPGVRPVSDDGAELILNRTWRPALEVTGLEGAPAIVSAGNVLRPLTAAKLSLRLPPTLDAENAGKTLKALLEADPPYGAKVTFEPEQAADGWNAPALAPWLRASIDRASEVAFGRPAALMGEGGSIPFMGMLGERFPEAQFVITGVLGPHSNAHGPNEFLHIGMGKGVTLAVAQVLADHFAR
jgi:acetylornithine deacetylase/succinyl-diaminopimelate desuccinylase-like protein